MILHRHKDENYISSQNCFSVIFIDLWTVTPLHIRERTKLECMSLYYKANFIFAFISPFFSGSCVASVSLSLTAGICLVVRPDGWTCWDVSVSICCGHGRGTGGPTTRQLGQLPSLSAAQWLPAHWLWVFTVIFSGQVHIFYALINEYFTLNTIIDTKCVS